jgi:serine/threonine protein kinase
VKFCPTCSEFYPNEATFCPKDGAELKRTHDPYLGRTIASRYRLTKRLGTGGMSTVYLANHVMIDRKSAIKILRDDLSLNPTHRERFLREARAVNRINHPNIVEISDLGEADGVAYLVMEFIDGPSLHQALARGPLPWERAVRIALQVSAALARAHQMGVIHRDLKPENILLAPRRRDRDGLTLHPLPLHSEEDLAKLTDFGIAKIVDAPALTFAEQLFGTPGYIAPEYIEGSECEPRSDLYSLGVIIYEMTTGRLPYDASGAGLLTLPLREPPIPPSRRVEGYPAPLEEVVLRLLSRDPEDRPPDAFFVYDALAHLLRVTPSMSPENPLPPVVSSTPEATRISYEAQGRVKEDAETMSGEVEAIRTTFTHQAAALADAEAAGTGRWHEAIAQLEIELAAAGRRKTDAARTERAAELLNAARVKLRGVERVSRAVWMQQAEVDSLEAAGRRFRDEIGKALDQLVRDRSRERAHGEAVRSRRESIEARGTPASDRSSDTSLWETAALSAAEENAGAAHDDISFQIESLQHSLELRNAAHDEEISRAAGVLEGSLSALRHLGHEIAWTLEEARVTLRAVG